MKYLLAVLLVTSVLNAEDGFPTEEQLQEYKEPVSRANETNILRPNAMMRVSVIGQGVAPEHTISPAQGYALAKRAAMADAYRLIAEKINGVVVEGQDSVRNMVMQRSTVRTQVAAMIKNATLLETTFKDGLCEVELEVKIKYDQFN